MNIHKIVIIHPNQTIDYIGSIDSLNTHSEALLEYAKDNYKNIPIFSKLNYRHTPETISYFYTLLGDVVFLNTTKDIKRHGYTGLFILPLEVSPEQKEHGVAFLFQCCLHNPENNMLCAGMYGYDKLSLFSWIPARLPPPHPAG